MLNYENAKTKCKIMCLDHKIIKPANVNSMVSDENINKNSFSKQNIKEKPDLLTKEQNDSYSTSEYDSFSPGSNEV